MTHDPVEAVVAAYLAYLEHDGPEPSLDHLSADDRRRAEELVALTNEGRGIDVYRSRPSVDMLLAGTEFESWLSPQDTAGLSIDAIRNDVVDALGSLAEPVADGAAEDIRLGLAVPDGWAPNGYVYGWHDHRQRQRDLDRLHNLSD